jgi:uncharacterized protein DUF6622
MNFVLQMLANTPPWVWALLALLLFLGIRALRPATAPLWRIAILPAVFFVWGLSGLFSLHSLTMQRIFPWVVALSAGIAIGLLIAGVQSIRADKSHRLVHVPGSSLTLVLSLLIFATKYAFGVLHATQPAMFAEPRFWLTELAVSGVLTGMFVGRFAGLWRQYRAAPHEDLAT